MAIQGENGVEPHDEVSEERENHGLGERESDQEEERAGYQVEEERKPHLVSK